MTENEFLRKVISDCAAALGNGSGCSTEASLEFTATVPAEIAAEVKALRAELEREQKRHEAFKTIVYEEMELLFAAGAEEMREALAKRFDCGSQSCTCSGRAIAECARALPLPSYKR